MFNKKLFTQHVSNRPKHIEEQQLLKEDPPGIEPRDPNKYGDYTPRPRVEPSRLTPDQIAAQDDARERAEVKRMRERLGNGKSNPRPEFERDVKPRRRSGPADPAPAVDPSADGDRFGDKIVDVANRLAKTGAYTQDELDRISTGQTGRPDKFTPDRGVEYPPMVPPTKPKAPSGGAGRREPMGY